MAKLTYYYALGRRKSSTARVRLYKGKGAITINGKTAEDYFANSSNLLERLQQPLELLDKKTDYDITVVVQGGGHCGQADAIRLGISKALVVANEELKTTLKKADLLGRDSREKERKKFGLKSARKQRQFTKR
jgi:small subunit ribosomal protein S9